MRKIKLLSFGLGLSLFVNAGTIYVGQSGDNSAGTSWATAYNTIQPALAAAVSGDEIWVAQGTYIISSADTQLNFKEGVNVYGGFAGTETSKDARGTDPLSTVIAHTDTMTVNFRLLTSVDLNAASTWDGFTFEGAEKGLGVKLSGNCTLQNAVVKNCRTINGSGPGVYMISGSDFIPVSLKNTKVNNNVLQVSSANTAQLGGAGVCIKSGSKMAEVSDCEISGNSIEGISATGALEGMGAGIYMYEGVIRNTVIDHNKVWNSVNAAYSNNNFTGGGIVIVPLKVDVPAKEALIENCKVTNNTSVSRGGGIVIDPRWSGEYQGNYTISKTIVANNKTAVVGGGIFCTAPTKQVGDGWTLNVTNSLIANNSASVNNAGGGVYINIGCVVNMTNCTVVNNFSGKYGGAGIFFQGPNNHTIKATVKDVVFWGNVCPSYAIDQVHFKNSGQSSTIVFSAIQDYDAASTMYTSATLGDNMNLKADNADAFEGPAFVAPDDSVGYYPTYNGSADWRLSSSSILVDAGDDYLTEDLLGNARPQGDFSDIGAYEYTAGTGLNQILANKSFAYANGSSIIFNNLDNLKNLNIYTIQGKLLRVVSLQDGLNAINTSASSLYMLKSGTFSCKVLVP